SDLWTLTALSAGVVAFYASARSLQIGDGVEVIAITSVAANLAAIIGGILVFHEPIGSGPLEIPARVLWGLPLLPRADRLWPTRDRRPLPRLLPRDRRRGAHARPDARYSSR